MHQCESCSGPEVQAGRCIACSRFTVSKDRWLFDWGQFCAKPVKAVLGQMSGRDSCVNAAKMHPDPMHPREMLMCTAGSSFQIQADLSKGARQAIFVVFVRLSSLRSSMFFTGVARMVCTFNREWNQVLLQMRTTMWRGCPSADDWLMQNLGGVVPQGRQDVFEAARCQSMQQDASLRHQSQVKFEWQWNKARRSVN